MCQTHSNLLLSASRPVFRRWGIAVALVMASTTLAVADEVWDSEWGSVVYETDKGNVAVWSFDGEGAASVGPGKMFIEGLGGVWQNRATDRPYRGYWMGYGSEEALCEESRTDAEGNDSRSFGTIEISFLDANFPARWRAAWGVCNDAPDQELNARPRTAGD